MMHKIHEFNMVPSHSLGNMMRWGQLQSLGIMAGPKPHNLVGQAQSNHCHKRRRNCSSKAKIREDRRMNAVRARIQCVW